MNKHVIYKDNIKVFYWNDGNYFYIDSPLCIDKHFRDTFSNIEAIKKYSLSNDNLVDIVDVSLKGDRVNIKTNYLQNYFPLTVMKTNHMLYSEATIQKISKYFSNLINRSINDLQLIYDNIVNSYQNFLDETGYYFFDISSNNLMVNHNENVFDYKIIDVLSIKKPSFFELEINPYSILFYHNFVKHGNYNENIFYNFITRNNSIKEIENYLHKLSQLKTNKIINR